ncbi:MAG: hypothetical protein GTN81_14830 [Proteobacteria bacterium]|nr:hypothetical protein [Pseudomonadota bacterium]
MNQIRNEFSWSKTRDDVFQTCPRQYFFNYYGHWGGWEKNAPERTRQIYILKNLKNRYMWAGEKVHECIKHTLRHLQRGIPLLDVDRIVSITLNQMREEFRSSRDKRYLTHPKTCALFEHEYTVELEDGEWKTVADNVEQCLRNFYGSDIFSMLKKLPRELWLEVEDFSSFYLDGKRIWAVIDCSFKTDDGATIIDWKTGRGPETDISLQLACYGMYAVEKWGFKPGKVKLVEYNLLADQTAEFSINAGEIENAKAYIRGSIADMQSLLVDVENNVPKAERFFEKVKDERTRGRCNFKKVCD